MKVFLGRANINGRKFARVSNQSEAQRVRKSRFLFSMRSSKKNSTAYKPQDFLDLGRNLGLLLKQSEHIEKNIKGLGMSSGIVSFLYILVSYYPGPLDFFLGIAPWILTGNLMKFLLLDEEWAPQKVEMVENPKVEELTQRMGGRRKIAKIFFPLIKECGDMEEILKREHPEFLDQKQNRGPEFERLSEYFRFLERSWQEIQGLFSKPHRSMDEVKARDIVVQLQKTFAALRSDAKPPSLFGNGS